MALVGRVGADDDGFFVREGLTGVNLDYLVQAGETGRAYILVDPEGERTILVAPHTNDELREEDIPWEALAQAGVIDLTSFAGAGPLALQRQIARRLQGGPRLTFDPGELYARRGRAALEELLDHTGTRWSTRRSGPSWVADCRSTPTGASPVVLIKRGPLGARLLTPVRYLDIPADFEGQPVDTLGAGDVFAAGLSPGCSSASICRKRCAWREQTAAYKLTGAGRERYPTKEIMERIIARLR